MCRVKNPLTGRSIEIEGKVWKKIIKSGNKNIIEKLKSQLNHRKCSICLDSKYNFKIFPCNHEVCKDCMENMISFNCPFCRKDFKSSLTKVERIKIETNVKKDKDKEFAEEILQEFQFMTTLNSLLEDIGIENENAEFQIIFI